MRSQSQKSLDSHPGKTYFSQSLGLKKLLQQCLFYFKGQSLKSKAALKSDGTTKDIKQNKNLKSKAALKSERGQVAIFMVFVFQVLFILFGMTINVGMTVYDKINFQNSLDLAAYYGAKKQAEVLNAMAHINYQMRQNWKLLSWRYRILGTLTQQVGTPSGQPLGAVWCPQNSGKNIGKNPTPPPSPPIRCPQDSDTQRDNPYYFVCVSHNTWKRGISKNTAIEMCEALAKATIPSVGSLALATGSGPIPFPWSNLAMDAIRNLQQSLERSCPLERALNYLTTHLFLTHARLDQKDRKTMLRQLYNKTLKDDRDLDGEHIYDGVKKVFYHNLTTSNQENVQSQGGSGQVLKPHNSSHGYNSFKDKDFKEIFGWINVLPILNYLYFNNGCDAGEIYPHIKYGSNNNLQEFFNNIRDQPNQNPWAGIIPPVQVTLTKFFNINNSLFAGQEHPTNPLGVMTLGFYKKTNTELYYGLFAEMNYEKRFQLFGLWGDVKFKASSFAKPFGGRFGPSPASPPGLDERIRHYQTENIPNIPDPIDDNNRWKLQPNYSRWPGDTLGLVDSTLHSNNQTNPYSNFLNKQSADHWTNDFIKQVYTVDAFLHLAVYRGGNLHDPLARPANANYTDTNPFHFMRMMELMAVWPDAYDIAHYSILGNYMKTYFPRVCKLLSPGNSNCQSSTPGEILFHSTGPIGPNTPYIRGDFGWPFTDRYMDRSRSSNPAQKRELSIAPWFLKRGAGTDPLINLTEIQTTGNFGRYNNNGELTQGKIFYPWLAQDLPAYLLSSWVPTRDFNRYEDYNKEPGLFEGGSPFMNCEAPVAEENMPVPSSCVAGGRSGYSVKLISCDVVKGIGAPPGSPGPYSNQPTWINEACPN